MESGEINRLVQVAIAVREHAYAPYSNFKVGAATLTSNGKIYPGCNVENASFGAGICAERNAIFSAVAAGERVFRAIAVVADTDELCSPCGICRQAASEFGLDILIIRANLCGTYDILPLSHYLPWCFSPADLPEKRPDD